MEHGTYVCVVVAHICKNKTFVPTVVIFKRWRRKICACGRAPWRPARRSFSPSLCKQNGTKNDKKRACSLLVSHSTPTSAKSFVIALPLRKLYPFPRKENYKLLSADVKGYASVLTHTLDCCLTQFNKPIRGKDTNHSSSELKRYLFPTHL